MNKSGKSYIRKFKEKILASKKKSILSSFVDILNKKLSIPVFIISMFILFILSLSFLIYFFWLLNPQENILNKDNYQTVTSEPVSLMLNISSPDDNLLTFDKNLLVSGKTSPGSIILINLNDNNQIAAVSPKGEFSATLVLDPEDNKLIIGAFDELGNSKMKEISIFYSEEKL